LAFESIETMKKSLFITLVGLLMLTSCAKKYCWECTTVESGGGTDTTYNTYCDMTEDDIQPKIGTTTAVDTSGTKPITINYTTTCEKQDD
jgi:hypothetical protein